MSTTAKNNYKIDRKAAARLLKVSVRTVDRYINAQKISHVRNDGRIWLSKREIIRYRDRNRVDTVDTTMSIDNGNRQSGRGGDSMSTQNENIISKTQREHAPSIFKKLYEELRDEYKIQQNRLEGANYRVGQLEGMLKESIPLLDHQKMLGKETAQRLELEEDIEALQETNDQLDEKLKDEKTSRRVILIALYILLAIQPLWILILR